MSIALFLKQLLNNVFSSFICRNTQIKATGLGPLNYLYSMALSRIAENGKDDVLPIIERELGDMIQQQIQSGMTFSSFETYAN